ASRSRSRRCARRRRAGPLSIVAASVPSRSLPVPEPVWWNPWPNYSVSHLSKGARGNAPIVTLTYRSGRSRIRLNTRSRSGLSQALPDIRQVATEHSAEDLRIRRSGRLHGELAQHRHRRCPVAALQRDKSLCCHVLLKLLQRAFAALPALHRDPQLLQVVAHLVQQRALVNPPVSAQHLVEIKLRQRQQRVRP